LGDFSFFWTEVEPQKMLKPKHLSDSPHAIDQLKHYLTLQLAAYLEKDWETYHSLEQNILDVEREL
jgi:hypothetical protein